MSAYYYYYYYYYYRMGFEPGVTGVANRDATVTPQRYSVSVLCCTHLNQPMTVYTLLLYYCRQASCVPLQPAAGTLNTTLNRILQDSKENDKNKLAGRKQTLILVFNSCLWPQTLTTMYTDDTGNNAPCSYRKSKNK